MALLDVVVGARPQFVKAAVVCEALRDADVAFEVVHTGQHYDTEMSEVFFSQLDITPPVVDLGIGSGSFSAQTGAMLVALEERFRAKRPDLVLVFGDTNSTLAAALTATKLRIPVAHVEAGIRQGDRHMSEEINRVLADHVSSLLFAPTESAVGNLTAEGFPSTAVHQVGDVMYDAALRFHDLAAQTSYVDELDLPLREYAVATVHRAENTDDPVRLEAIVRGLEALALEMPIAFPVHPRTRKALDVSGLATTSLGLMEPIGYLEMLCLLQDAALVVTDSGGLQKEAFFQEVPCVVLSETTGWMELVDLGWNRLVPPLSAEDILRGCREAVGTKGKEAKPYGDGNASGAAARVIASYLEALG